MEVNIHLGNRKPVFNSPTPPIMLIVLHCWMLLQASMNPNNNNGKCSQTSYNRSVRQIEGQGVILWPQVMVRIIKILKIKKNMLFWSLHACVCLPQLTRLTRVATQSTLPTRPTQTLTRSTRTPTRLTRYQINHPSRVAS